MKTIKEFVKVSSIEGALIRAVIKQIGGWEAFQQSAPDVDNHGASGGFGGFIYYIDTCTFYAKHRVLIVELVEYTANQLGEGSIQLVQGFNCLGKDYTWEEIGKTLYSSKRHHDTQIANALAWFALEEVCRSYCDAREG